jgi:4-diphosphocytidyl-2-C-methyl-D-erythritol kinase
MPSPTTLACPAKVNLFLEVRGRRPDGYHELGTLFQAVEFGDSLSAESWDRIEVVSDVEIPGRPEDNLVYKAALLLKTLHGGRLKPGQGIRYSLKKRIPTGAGLGGGSSDAAAALQLANEIWELGLSHGELRSMALELGADVAFFQFHPSAFAEGRGEILSRAPEPFPFHVVLATPFCRVETAWAYRQLQGRHFGTEWGKFKSSYVAGAGNPSFYAGLHNDFEDIMAAHFHEIRDVRDILTSFQPQKTLLTGSGASLFALFVEKAKAGECLNAVAPHCRFSTLTRFKTGEFF